MLTAKRLIFMGTLVIVIGLGATFLIRNHRHGHWEKVRRGRIIEAIYGLATLEAEEIFRYRSGITTQVTQVHVKEGQNVRQGEVLMRLSEGGPIKTPIEGVVTQLDAKANETSFPNSTLVTVTNLQQVELSITLEQASALRVRPGQRVRIQFESLQGTPLKGLVRTLYPKEGQFAIRVRLDPGQILPNLLPGMTADTAIEAGEKNQVLLVPLRSVFQGSLLARVEGKKQKLKPSFGIQSAEFIEVLETETAPLREGTEIWVPDP